MRRATLDDFEIVKKLFLQAKEESSVYDTFPVDTIKSDENLKRILTNNKFFVYFTDDCLLVSHLESPWFSSAIGIREDILYVIPEKRKGRLGYRLIKLLIEVAKQQGASYIIAGSSLHPDKADQVSSLYKYAGFNNIGYTFQREI